MEKKRVFEKKVNVLKNFHFFHFFHRIIFNCWGVSPLNLMMFAIIKLIAGNGRYIAGKKLCFAEIPEPVEVDSYLACITG